MSEFKTQEQIAVETLRALAKIAASGKKITITGDWGFGTATLFTDDNHCHIGCDSPSNTDDENFEQFVFGLHRVLTGIASEIQHHASTLELVDND